MTAARLVWIGTVMLLVLPGCGRNSRPAAPASPAVEAARSFAVTGIVQEVKSAEKTVVVRHEAIPGYMAAMTMPFKARDRAELESLRAADAISFRLHVTSEESWIDGIVRMGHGQTNAEPETAAPEPVLTLNDIPEFHLTNELGQAVSLRQFNGVALALTFFFTRCPIPEFCPRLTRNFQQVVQKLAARANTPTNWHLLSISFDPFDTPPVLRSYGLRYQYDPAHWSFLTGPAAEIRELCAGFGMKVSTNGALFDHGFQTVIFDAQGRVQSHWPVGGDTSQMIIDELIRGASAARSP